MSLWTFLRKADQAVTAGPLGGTTQTLSWGATNTATDLLLCLVSWTSATLTVSSVSDTTNAYTPLTSKISYGTNQNMQLFYVLSCVAPASQTVTCTFSGTGATNVQLSLVEYTPPSNQQTATAVDVFISSSGSSATPSSGATAANVAANELVIGYSASGTGSVTWTAGTGFVLRTTSASRGNALEDLLLSGYSTTGQTGTFSISSGAWACGVVVFKPGSTVTVDAPTAGELQRVPGRFSPTSAMVLGNFIPGSLPGTGQIISV